MGDMEESVASPRHCCNLRERYVHVQVGTSDVADVRVKFRSMTPVPDFYHELF